jgi:hypothetical protein
MTPDLAPRRVPQPPPKGLRGVPSEQPAPDHIRRELNEEKKS